MNYDITIQAPEVPHPGGHQSQHFMRTAARNLRGGYPVGGSNVTETIARLLDSVADAMDEQQPRIPEPGLWGVVEAGVKQHDARLKWSHLADGAWQCEDIDEYDRLWPDLVDPVLIRDGIEDGAK